MSPQTKLFRNEHVTPLAAALGEASSADLVSFEEQLQMVTSKRVPREIATNLRWRALKIVKAAMLANETDEILLSFLARVFIYGQGAKERRATNGYRILTRYVLDPLGLRASGRMFTISEKQRDEGSSPRGSRAQSQRPTPYRSAMPSLVFKPIDRPYLIEMVESTNSHSTLGKYESGLDVDFSGSPNKMERSRRLIEHLYKQPNGDRLILDLLNHTYGDGNGAHRRREDDTFLRLKEKVLDVRGVVLGDDGFEFRQAATTPASAPEERTRMIQPAPEPPPSRDPKAVFLVHGRDTRPYKVLETFLHFLGLRVMSWPKASSLTNKAQPSTYEIVKAGIDAAGATIVIWSPDDEARLKSAYAGEDSDATELRAQARQNVILEAGLAYGTAPDRTIFVQSEAPIRWPTDVDGFNWVKLNGEWDSRKLLIDRLRSAGARPEPADDNLAARLAGPFKVE